SQIARHQDRHRLGVGLGLEAIAQARQLGLELLKILDDAVVDDRDAVGGDRMGVGLARHAMRRPAGMADADPALDRLLGETRLEPRELALGAAALDMAIDQRRDAGRIIAAIFEPPEPLDEQRRHLLTPDDANDAAHQPLLRFALAARVSCFCCRHCAARPAFTTWRPRPSASASAGTSWVMTLPAAIIAPAPIAT